MISFLTYNGALTRDHEYPSLRVRVPNVITADKFAAVLNKKKNTYPLRIVNQLNALAYDGNVYPVIDAYYQRLLTFTSEFDLPEFLHRDAFATSLTHDYRMNTE